MAKSKVNFNTITDLLGSGAIPIIREWLETYPDWESMTNWCFVIGRFPGPNGFVYGRGQPYYSGGGKQPSGVSLDHAAIIRLVNYKSEPNALKEHEYEKIDYILNVCFEWLKDKTPGYCAYNVTFAESGRQLGSWHDSFKPFWAGYVGITGRNPLVRFAEHRRDVRNGTGYYFHSSWRALLHIDDRISPLFTLLRRANTLDEIYDIEEELVAGYTLAPKGLNAIPGGKAGLRMLHLFRKGDGLPSLAERDAAFIDLENGRSTASTHFRKGHVRHLPATCAKRTTWVSSCWVGLEAAAA